MRCATASALAAVGQMPNPRCNCRSNDATASGKPRYAPSSGGLRTFLVTWPALACNLIERNGGRSNWWLGIESPYDGRTQSKVGAAALDVVGLGPRPYFRGG